MMAELNRFTQVATQKDGSLQKFAADPGLYRNMNQSAESLAVVLKNLEPVVRDLRLFSDKIARHPELLGISGAVSPSSGLKDDESRQSGVPAAPPR
jgi:phospholipid/cholesterol/gamma-HCH transport system substrate-binding protein